MFERAVEVFGGDDHAQEGLERHALSVEDDLSKVCQQLVARQLQQEKEENFVLRSPPGANGPLAMAAAAFTQPEECRTAAAASAR